MNDGPKRLKIALLLRPPPAYTLSRQVRNPFTTGQTIYSYRTGLVLGQVAFASIPTYDNYHWAHISPDLYVFDYDIGQIITLSDPKPHHQSMLALPVPSASVDDLFFIGQRLFYKSDYRVATRSFVGVVRCVFPPLHEAAEWRCLTDLSENFGGSSLYNNLLTAGQRKHREPTIITSL